MKERAKEESFPFLSQAPVVSDAVGANRPFSVALSVTVGGLNFRTLDATVTAQTAGGTCGTAAWTSASSVQCLQSSTAAPGDSSIVVTVSGSFIGTAAAALTFDGTAVSMPTMSSVDPMAAAARSSFTRFRHLSARGEHAGGGAERGRVAGEQQPVGDRRQLCFHGLHAVRAARHGGVLDGVVVVVDERVLRGQRGGPACGDCGGRCGDRDADVFVRR